jgi:hypothetical protein
MNHLQSRTRLAVGQEKSPPRSRQNATGTQLKEAPKKPGMAKGSHAGDSKGHFEEPQEDEASATNLSRAICHSGYIGNGGRAAKRPAAILGWAYSFPVAAQDVAFTRRRTDRDFSSQPATAVEKERAIREFDLVYLGRLNRNDLCTLPLMLPMPDDDPIPS